MNRDDEIPVCADDTSQVDFSKKVKNAVEFYKDAGANLLGFGIAIADGIKALRPSTNAPIKPKSTDVTKEFDADVINILSDSADAISISPTFNDSAPAPTEHREPIVIFTFDEKKELVSLVVEGVHKSLSGRFSDGKVLLLALWNAPEHKLAKKAFDKQYPEVRRKGKSQLQNKIGAGIFNLIYLDNGQGDDFIKLSNDIEVKLMP